MLSRAIPDSAKNNDDAISNYALGSIGYFKSQALKLIPFTQVFYEFLEKVQDIMIADDGDDGYKEKCEEISDF